MATPPLQATQQKWRQRAAMAQQVGVPASSVSALANYDTKRVAAGSQPLTNQEVEDALNAQLYHTPVVQQTPPHGLLNILGNVPSDVGGIIRGFMPGLFHFVQHLPSEVGQLGSDLAHPSLQRLSHDPILSLIPGLYDLGQIATPKGRQWMESHPVSSLLDVLPLASSAGKAAMAGRAVEAGSAGEALARGSVVRASLRAGTDTLSNVVSKTLSRDINIRGTLEKKWKMAGLDVQTRELLSRPVAQMTRKAQAEMMAFWDHSVAPLMKDLSMETRRDLAHDATIGGGVAKNPGHQHILDAIRQYNQMAFVRGSEEKALYGIVVPGGHQAVYDYAHPVAKAHRKLTKAKTATENAEKRLTRSVAAHARRTAKGGESDQTIIQKRYSDLMSKRQKMEAAHADFTTELAQSPDAAFLPKITEMVRSGVEQQVRQGNIAAHIQVTQEVFDQIAGAPSEKWMKSLLPKGEYEAIRSSAMGMWLDMAKDGFTPIWIKKTSPEQLDRSMFPRPNLERNVTPSDWKRRILNFGPGMQDIAAGITASESEWIRTQLTRDALDHVATQFGKSQKAVYPEYVRYAQDAKRVATMPVHMHAESLMNKEWEKFDPASFGLNKRSFAHHPEDLLIPKGVARSLRIMQGGYRLFGKEHAGGVFGINGLYDKALHVFRMSVLTGPRHFIHVAGGGLAFMTMRNPMALGKLSRAWDLFNNGKVPNELMGAVTDFKADQVWNFKVGQKVGGLWKDFAGKAGNLHDKYVAFEQKVATVQRAAVYLDKIDKIGHEAALQEAYKTFVELDSMAPFERAVMKQMIPFYPFMRHLFRYLFTLPVDHPYRVAILQRFSQQEEQEWSTGLPDMYQSYLFMGKPDQNGNVVGVDTKNINPFRSFYNDFTLAGFVSASNPLFTSFGTAMGLNVLSASPNLYSDWSYNPVTGGKTTSRPMNFGAAILESFIPATQAIDATLGLSNRYRSLRQTNPAAFQRELFNYLNIPFATSKVNIPLTGERAEITRLQAAQAAVSQAMKSGDWSQVERFNLVPYNGQLVSASALAQQMSGLQKLLAQYGIADPNAVLRKPATSVPFHLA